MFAGKGMFVHMQMEEDESVVYIGQWSRMASSSAAFYLPSFLVTESLAEPGAQQFV